MKTDTLFYQLFQSFHTLLFELIDLPITEAEGYQFSSAEIKEKAFRFDGIFRPEENHKPIFFIEVQFQYKEDFYWELLSEIFLYLNQYRPSQDWQAVAIFAKRNCEPEASKHVQEMFDSHRIIRVYLEDFVKQDTNSLGIAIICLILASDRKTPAIAKNLAAKVEQEPNPNVKELVVKFVETVLIYKFPTLSRQEIETMFTDSDLKQTRVYQEAMQLGEQRGLQLGEQRGLQLGEQRGLQLGEQRGLQLGKQQGLQLGKQQGLQLGKQQGLAKGQATMLLRVLTRKFGRLSPKIRSQITKLSVKRLESLAEAIFDLEAIADLNAWLTDHPN